MVLCLQALWRECPAIWVPVQAEGGAGKEGEDGCRTERCRGDWGRNRNGKDAERANWNPREKGADKARRQVWKVRETETDRFRETEEGREERH